MVSTAVQRDHSDQRRTTEGGGHSTKRKRIKKRKGAINSIELTEASTRSSPAPWVSRLEFTTSQQNFEQRLHHEILAFVSYTLPTSQERKARQYLFAAIAKVLERRYPTGEAVLFGSVAHDLCLPDSDIDICFRVADENAAHVRFLYQLSHLLKAAGIPEDIEVNKWAKVPVINLTTTLDLGCIKVDIGVNNIDGAIAVDIINEYLSTMPALRPLVIVVKAFLAERCLNNAATSGLSSYALICMAISFLQLNPTNRPVDVIEKALETESLGVLVMDFFHYYGNIFPYQTSYISVNERKLLPKSSARWIVDTLSDRLAVQCLVNHDIDVAKSTGKINAVKAAFREAHKILSSLRTSETCYPLGKIIPVTLETLAHRTHIQTIVDTGGFDRALIWASIASGSECYRSVHTNSGPAAVSMGGRFQKRRRLQQ